MKITRKWRRAWLRGGRQFTAVVKPIVRAKTLRPAIAAGLALTLLLGSPNVQALPVNGTVVAGQGTVAQSGNNMTITQNTDKLALNWQSFSIAQNEKVQFIQPGAASVALNRVIGNNASQIYGQLSANGKVFLINTNGILFSPTARVDTGALVASALNMKDQDFLAGNYKFAAGENNGSVVNQGRISAGEGGFVALLGNAAVNEGVIVANKGSVALGAGTQATLDMTGDGLITLAVDQGALNAKAENKNLIEAQGGFVVMTARTAGELSGTVVNNSGVIRAQSMSVRNGKIVLDGGNGMVTNSGTLDVSSETGQGGKITVNGDRVLVAAGSHLTASGALGGGEVLVGGSWQGQDASVQQATGTIVESGALLEANATDQGNGGTVVAWSDVTKSNSVTRAYGTFQAKGGANGGDGGRIETSGHWLDVAGSDGSAAAAKGKSGVWLFDPYNVTIAASDAGGAWDSGSGSQWTPTGSGSTISADTIQSKLNTGTSVAVTTGTSGSENGDITVDAAIEKTSGDADVTLTMQAANTIVVNQNIKSSGGSGKLNVTLDADNDNGVGNGVGIILLNADIATGGGNLSFGTGRTATVNGGLTLVGGDVYVGGGGARTLSTGGGAVDVKGEMLVANKDGLTIDSSGGNVRFYGLLDSGNTYEAVNAGSGITWTNALTAAKSGDGGSNGDTYLATITSRLENAVAGWKVNYAESWLGGRRVVGIGTNNLWRWVTGPEGLQDGGKGLPFFTQAESEYVPGSSTDINGGGTAIGGAYSNWNSPSTGREPNNWNNPKQGLSVDAESALQFIGKEGKWNDLSASVSPLYHYVKETNLAASPVTIKAGNGNVQFDGAVGSNKALGALDIQTAKDVAFNSSVNVAGAIKVGSTTAAHDVIIKNAVTTKNGNVAINNTNLLKIAAAGDMNLDGAFSQTNARKVWTAGDITTTGDAITFNSPVVLTGDVSMASAGGDITFNNTIKAAPAAGETPAALNLSAGSGDVAFKGQVGGYDYETTAVGMNPIAYWSFDEKSGSTAADSSGNNITAAVGGNVKEGVTSAAGLGTAFQFTSSGSDTSYYVTASDSNLSVKDSSFTHLVWINPNLSDSAYHAVMGYQVIDAKDRYPSLYVYNGGDHSTAALHGGFGDGAWNSYISGKVIQQNAWNLVVQRFDVVTGKLDISVNGGAFTNVGTFSGHKPNSTTSLNIGFVDNTFNGLIDEPAMFKTRLTDAQVQTLYKAATDANAPLKSVTVAGANQVTIDKGVYANNISLTADKVAIDTTNGALNASGNVVIRPATVDRTINLGAETAGSLSLTNAEIGRITAGTLRIGDTAAGVAGALSGSGINAGAITVSDAVNFVHADTVNLISAAAVTETGGGSVTAKNLAVTAGGAVTLANAANSVAKLAGKAGGTINFVNQGAVTVDTVDAVSGITATGDAGVATLSGDLTVAQNISTSSISDSAVVLNAGKASAAGVASGGNVIIAGSSRITTGTGGRASLYSGSVAGSTGMTGLIGEGSARFRYNSDEAAANYTAALGTGIYGIYREQPTLTITADNKTVDYGTVPSLSTTVSGLRNGDTARQAIGTLATVAVGGSLSSSGAYTVGDHTLTPSSAVGGLGYNVAYATGTLTVNEKKETPVTVTPAMESAKKNVLDNVQPPAPTVINNEGSDNAAVRVANNGVSTPAPFSGAAPVALDLSGTLNLVAIGNQTTYTMTSGYQSVTIASAGATPATAAAAPANAGNVVLVTSDARTGNTVVGNCSVVSTGNSLTLSSAAPVPSLNLDLTQAPGGSADMETFQLAVGNGGIALFGASFKEGAVNVTPLNTEAVVLSRNSGDILRVLAANGVVTIQDKQGVSVDRITTVYIQQE